jgi:putative addiction module killer protein
MEVRQYVDAVGRSPYQAWLEALRDNKGRLAVMRRINRLQTGNPGDYRYCRGGIWELRIDAGPGYRVYYAREGQSIVLLLGAGDKSTQDRDIVRAIHAWQDYIGRN